MLLKRLEQWDHTSFSAVFNRCSSRLMYLVSFYTSKTADGPCYLLIIAALYLLAVAEAGNVALALAVAFACELPLYLVLKNLIKRARPTDVLSSGLKPHIVPSDRFSLPSGHTAGAFVVATVLSSYFPLLMPLLLLWAVSIGLSRIALGVHFPTDVLAGAVLGCSCATFALLNLQS